MIKIAQHKRLRDEFDQFDKVSRYLHLVTIKEKFKWDIMSDFQTLCKKDRDSCPYVFQWANYLYFAIVFLY